MRKSTSGAGLQKSPHTHCTRYTSHKTITVIHIHKQSCVKHSHMMLQQVYYKSQNFQHSLFEGEHVSDEGLGAAELQEDCLQGVQLVRQALDRSGGRHGG